MAIDKSNYGGGGGRERKCWQRKMTNCVYIAKLEELKKRGDPIEVRFKEHSERGAVIDQLVYCINSYREAAMSNDPKFDHIEVAEKQKVLNECVEAEAWLREKQQQQESLPKHSTPAILSVDVRKKAEALDRFCRPIMTKPKPVKPATPEASPAPSEGGDHPMDAEISGSPNKDSNENAGEKRHNKNRAIISSLPVRTVAEPDRAL